MKTFRLWLFALAVSFYTTFVLQILWNWFVVGALSVPTISYWQMYGLHMLVGLVIERDKFDEDNRWKRAFLFLSASVPPEKKAEVGEEIESDNENMWLAAGMMVFGRVLASSAALAIGFVIHILAS